MLDRLAGELEMASASEFIRRGVMLVRILLNERAHGNEFGHRENEASPFYPANLDALPKGEKRRVGKSRMTLELPDSVIESLNDVQKMASLSSRTDTIRFVIEIIEGMVNAVIDDRQSCLKRRNGEVAEVIIPEFVWIKVSREV
jgi:hypothetical protein